MERFTLRRCLAVSIALHFVVMIFLAVRAYLAQPPAIGVLEVTLLALPDAPVADGRAIGAAKGSDKPIGRSVRRAAPTRKQQLSERRRTRMPRFIAPRRDAAAARVCDRFRPRTGAGTLAQAAREAGPGPRKDAAGRSRVARSSAPVATGDGAVTGPGTDPVATPRRITPAGDPEVLVTRVPEAIAAGQPEAADAALGERPSPDPDFMLAAGPEMPGIPLRTGKQGTGKPAGDRGTGGATRNRGYLGNGLLGEYFADPQRAAGDYPLNMRYDFPTFSRLVYQRIDPAVDFTWDMQEPAPGVPSAYFSARWSGKLLAPATDTYVFYLENLDDGGRLFINGEKVAESWMIQQGITVVRALPLEGGVHDFRVEYCQGPETHASVRVAWSSSQFGKEVITAVPLPRSPRLIAGLARK